MSWVYLDKSNKKQKTLWEQLENTSSCPSDQTSLRICALAFFTCPLSHYLGVLIRLKYLALAAASPSEQLCFSWVACLV